MKNVIALIRHMESGKVSHRILLNSFTLKHVNVEFLRQRPSGALVRITYKHSGLANAHEARLRMGEELVLTQEDDEQLLVSYDRRRSIFVAH